MCRPSANWITIFVIAVLAQPAFAQRLSLKATKEEPARWELRTAPIALLAKWITLDVSYRLTENFAFGPAAIFYVSPEGEQGGMLAPGYNGYAAGLNFSYYFNSVQKNTGYLSMHGYYENFSAFGHGTRDGERTEVDGIKVNTAIGYQWKKSRFVLLTGFGVQYQDHQENGIRFDQNGNTTKTTESDSGFLPFVEFKVGIEI